MRTDARRFRRRLFLLASLLGLINAVLLVRPWARDTVAATPMATAAAPASQSQSAVDSRALLAVGKTQLLSSEDGARVRASLMFVSYFLMSTRSLAAHCAAEGIDIATSAEAFAAAHQGEYGRASEILAGHGLNADLVWALYADQLERLSSGHLEQIGARHVTDRAGACRAIAAAGERYASVRSYAKNYPALHAALMGG